MSVPITSITGNLTTALGRFVKEFIPEINIFESDSANTDGKKAEYPECVLIQIDKTDKPSGMVQNNGRKRAADGNGGKIVTHKVYPFDERAVIRLTFKSTSDSTTGLHGGQIVQECVKRVENAVKEQQAAGRFVLSDINTDPATIFTIKNISITARQPIDIDAKGANAIAKYAISLALKYSETVEKEVTDTIQTINVEGSNVE